MNTAPYLAAVAIPCFTVLVGILINYRGLDSLEKRMDRRFDQVEKRFEQVDKRFDRVDVRLDKLQSDLDVFHRSLGQHDKAIEILEKRA